MHLDLDIALDVEEEELPSDLEVRYATREHEARQVLATEDVILVVSDLSLDVGPEPPEDGLDVVRALREDGLLPEEIPVVFRTGYSAGSVERAKRRGFPHWFTRDDDRAFTSCVLDLLAHQSPI